MGNFTQDAFWTEVSPRVRREMADYARDALLTAGTPPDAIPWPSSDDAPTLEPDLLLVIMTTLRRIQELAVAFRASIDADPLPSDWRERAVVVRELILSWEYVGQDLLNTLAGDITWNDRVGAKRLGAVTDKLRGPVNGIKGDLGFLVGLKKVSSASIGFTKRTIDTAIKRLTALLPKLEAATKDEEPKAEKVAKPPAKAKPARKKPTAGTSPRRGRRS